jgi:hypothetical protein
MHYWSKQAKSDFFAALAEKNEPGRRQFLIEEPGRPDYAIESVARSDDVIKAIGLEPGPWLPAVS